MIRIVLDTNIFISGIFWEGNYCSKIIHAWRANTIHLVTSLALIDELAKTLRTFKIQMDEEMIEEWCHMIIENAIIVEPRERITIVTDPDDNKFLEAAVAGNAQYIISQDKQLLKVKEYKRIKIINPKEFGTCIADS